MRYFEIITETTEEDRAIISLSSAISSYLTQHYDNSDEDELSSDNPDFDFDDDERNDEDTTIDVGTIGQLFDTPLNILNPIHIQIQSDYGIRQRRKWESGSTVIRKPGSDDVLGLWYGDKNVIILNKDYLGSNSLKTVISHELRHALDDYKSGFAAGDSAGYNTAKDKESRKELRKAKRKGEERKMPVAGSYEHLAEPAEINARFIEVLHSMVPIIKHAYKMSPDRMKAYVMDAFEKKLDYHNISTLFPDKEKSKDYRRLVNRGKDFIQKEMSHRETERNAGN